jgi:hypothetical protein
MKVVLTREDIQLIISNEYFHTDSAAGVISNSFMLRRDTNIIFLHFYLISIFITIVAAATTTAAATAGGVCTFHLSLL